VWRLLRRRGVEVAYLTLHRFAVEELGFGRARATVPVVDGVPLLDLEILSTSELEMAAQAITT